MRQLLAVLLALVIGAPSILAQNTSNVRADAHTIAVDVELVNVDVTVIDPMGQSVSDLERENFRVFEDGIEQEIINFGHEDIPLAACIVADTSGSMTDKMDKLRQALKEFVRIANKNDEFCLAAFDQNDRAMLVSPFTTAKEIESKIVSLAAGGQTPLLDAMDIGLRELAKKRAEERRRIEELQRIISLPQERQKEIDKIHKKYALVVISDGGDNHSRITENDIKRAVQELEAQIYAIGIFDPIDYRSRSAEELNGPSLLQEITEKTGGRVLPVENSTKGLNDLPRIAAEISTELKEQYQLQYKYKPPAPSKKNTGRKKSGKNELECHKIKVQVKPPKGMPPLEVYARTGYCRTNH